MLISSWQVQHLECVLATKEELMTQIQQSHDTQINKLASTSDKTSADWHQQKQELERHYSHLLEEIHTRHKVEVTHAALPIDIYARVHSISVNMLRLIKFVYLSN